MSFLNTPGFPVLKNGTALFLLLLLFSGCATVVEVTEEEEEIVEETPEAPAAFSTVLTASDLAELRLSPTDRFRTFELNVPDAFQVTDEELQRAQSNRGFRIQLLSTENMALADSLLLAYYDWALEYDGHIFATVPEAYVTFRQPFYRVRIGDFRRRSDANAYLAILRTHFPGAWVVIDTIDLTLAP